MRMCPIESGISNVGVGKMNKDNLFLVIPEGYGDHVKISIASNGKEALKGALRDHSDLLELSEAGVNIGVIDLSKYASSKGYLLTLYELPPYIH